jgi:hypothetical protein
MYEYDHEAPRDRSWFWKLGLLVTTVLAGIVFLIDLIPVVIPAIEPVIT